MDPITFFGTLKTVASGDYLALIKFFEEDPRVIATFEAIGDVNLDAATGAIRDARLSRRPTREIEQAVTLLRASHTSFTKALNAVPPSGDEEHPTFGDYVWGVRRELRSWRHQSAGRWAADAEQALAVCRVAALLAVCHAYLREDRQVERWLDQLRADFAQFSRVHPDGNPDFGRPMVGGQRELGPYFRHLPYREMQLEVSQLSARLTHLVLTGGDPAASPDQSP